MTHEEQKAEYDVHLPDVTYYEEGKVAIPSDQQSEDKSIQARFEEETFVHENSTRREKANIFLRQTGDRPSIFNLKCCIERIFCRQDYSKDYIHDTSVDPPATQQQYHIPPANDKSQRKNSFFSLERNTAWLYTSNFRTVLLWFAFVYIFLVTLFAVFIYAFNIFYERRTRQCMYGWDPTEPGYAKFETTVSLSWTTFTTVGYGHVSPLLTARCIGLELLCALEAFIGLLYVAFCGSIIFAKIVLLHSKARVTFSNILCLEYSRPEVDRGLQFHEQEIGHFEPNHTFPFLEFRIVNDDANNTKRSAILDASVQCVVISYHEAKNGCNYLPSRDIETHHNIQVDNLQSTTKGSRQEERIPVLKKHFDRLQVEPSNTPFFTRVWYVRHQLNQDSPLLKPYIKERIMANQGRWPIEFNDYSEIRDTLIPFQRIVVTFSGTSIVTMEQVIAYTSYNFDDIYIGWQFARIFHCISPFKEIGSRDVSNHNRETDESDKIFHVDKTLVHDIIPQCGGGNEPLSLHR